MRLSRLRSKLWVRINDIDEETDTDDGSHLLYI